MRRGVVARGRWFLDFAHAHPKKGSLCAKKRQCQKIGDTKLSLQYLPRYSIDL